MTWPPPLSPLASPLAAAFLAGEWEWDGLVERGRSTLDRPAPWLERVASEVLAAYHHPPRDRPRELVAFLKLILARDRPPAPLPRARRFFTFEQEMGRRRWPVAELDTLADLAALLELSPGRLASS